MLEEMGVSEIPGIIKVEDGTILYIAIEGVEGGGEGWQAKLKSSFYYF